MVSTILLASLFIRSNLEVGPGKTYARIEPAVSAAAPGDTILVYPDPGGYPATAVKIQTASITIRGVSTSPVIVKGTGFDYSGSGSVPRAIFQVDPTGSGSTIENLNISDAHNQTFNGAGVRIQAANNVTVTDCIIRGNDMGIMSNGTQGDPNAGSEQQILYCLIEKNGNLSDPGFNHNLYLGGTSARLSHCEIGSALTGHNVKSRTHYVQIESCYIHDSANREIDLPESWDTSRPNSNAVLIGNRIVKDPNCPGNHGVIHFGTEGGTRVGKLFCTANTVVSQFASPVFLITSPGSPIVATGNIFLNMEQNQATLISSVDSNQSTTANTNLISFAYGSLGGDNQTGSTRSESFGLQTPSYLFPSGELGKPTVAGWLDGNGRPRSGRVTLGSSFEVGPRGQQSIESVRI